MLKLFKKIRKIILHPFYKKEFKNQCPRIFPCQCCPNFRLRGKYRNKCEMAEKLLEKYHQN